ncbi:MAG TPA: S53 family peptidase [Kofleriaceae bacterium]
MKLVVLAGLSLAACAVPSSDPAPSTSAPLVMTAGFADRVANIVAKRPAPPPGAFCTSGLARCFIRGQVDENGNRIHGVADPAGMTDNWGATDLESAYAIPVSNDTQATVAIVDAYGYSALESDLATYRQMYNLPACGTSDGCLKIVDQNGGNNLPADNSDWIGETSLDVDMVSAGCPSCKILVVQATDDSSDGLFVAVKTAASMGATVISNSWGYDESDLDEAFQVTVAQAEPYMDHPGIAVFVATGDDGYNDGGMGPDYPGTSAYSIGVGGTSLSKTTSGSRAWSEKAWSDGGAACSLSITMPSWQSSTSSCTMRMTSDVSAVGDPNTGVAVYDSDDGGWEVVGGTSAASPLTASIFALTNNGNRTAQFAYQNAAAFNDVTSGKDGTCGAKLCTAGSGWDGPTGIGTPNGTALAALGGGNGSGSGSGSNMGSGSDSGSGSNMGSGSDDNNGSGSGSDDGNGDNGDGNSGGGGGCNVAGGSGAATFLFALGLALVRRRRRA